MSILDFLSEQNGSTATSYATDVAAYRDLIKTNAIKTQLATVSLTRGSRNKSYTAYQFASPYQSNILDSRIMSPTTLGVVAQPYPYDKYYPSSDSQRNNLTAQTTQASQFALQILYRWALGLSSGV